MKSKNSVSLLDLATVLNANVRVVVERFRAFLEQGGFINNFDPVFRVLPRTIAGDWPEADLAATVRADAVRRGMDDVWSTNLENVAKGLCQFFGANKSKWYRLGAPVLEVGDVEVPLAGAGAYARRDVATKVPFIGVAIVRASFPGPGRTPMAEALKNLAGLIHHTQQRRMRDQLFGASVHRTPNVELLVRRKSSDARVVFDRIVGDQIVLMTEAEIERLLTVFLEALDILGSRHISVLKAKYGPKRAVRRPDEDQPDLFTPRTS